MWSQHSWKNKLLQFIIIFKLKYYKNRITVLDDAVTVAECQALDVAQTRATEERDFIKGLKDFRDTSVLWRDYSYIQGGLVLENLITNDRQGCSAGDQLYQWN